MQLHGMETGFMSQRVVKDIGNYIGKFIESDANNFVGVWHEYFRVRVSIPLNVPLKRRMKLKKSDTNWGWVTFKYEGLPTFCFICGMIGHGDKFCEKLFDTPGGMLEKPYGSWMRAEQRKRMHTMESKWLRSGGAIPVNNTGDEKGDNIVTVKNATEISHSVKSGTVEESNSKGVEPKQGKISGVLSANLNNFINLLPIIQENIVTNLDSNNGEDLNVILVNDPKRRKLGQEEASPDVDMSTSPQDIAQDQ